MIEGFVTVEEAAAIMQVNASRVRQKAIEGSLGRSFKFNDRAWVIDVEAARNYVRKRLPNGQRRESYYQRKTKATA